MGKIFWKTFYLIFGITFVLSWIFLLIKEYWIGLKIFYSAAFFPFVYFSDKLMDNLMSEYGPPHWLNDEITELVIYLTAIGLQSLFYIGLFYYTKKIYKNLRLIKP